jgi:hypothetical protein
MGSGLNGCGGMLAIGTNGKGFTGYSRLGLLDILYIATELYIARISDAAMLARNGSCTQKKIAAQKFIDSYLQIQPGDLASIYHEICLRCVISKY